VLSCAGLAGRRAQAPRWFGAAPAAVGTTRWRFGRFGGSAMRMTAPPPVESDRNTLVIAHVGLVKAMAHRLAQRLPAQVEMNELISVGVIGLIDAADRYKPAMGVPFDAFARRRVQGAMLDALRELDWAPRSLRRMRRDLDQAIARLRHTLKREPNEDEVAGELS